MFYGHIVDTGLAPSHEAAVIELPQFIAVATEPTRLIIVPFILKTNGNAVIAVGPQFLDQPIIQFTLPFGVRNWTIACRPQMNLSRLRQTESSLYASETRCGSRVFQAFSAARTFAVAFSRLNGGQIMIFEFMDSSKRPASLICVTLSLSDQRSDNRCEYVVHYSNAASALDGWLSGAALGKSITGSATLLK